MNKIYLVFFFLLSHLFLETSQAQRLESFSENPGEFLAQLEELMTASKQKTLLKIHVLRTYIPSNRSMICRE